MLQGAADADQDRRAEGAQISKQTRIKVTGCPKAKKKTTARKASKGHKRRR